jgi:hypothetical protein
MPRSALVSDLPVGDGARVEMQDARCKAATQTGGRRFSRSSAAGGNPRCAAAIAPKSPGRRKKWPGRPRRTAAAQSAAYWQWFGTNTTPVMGFIPSYPMPTALVGSERKYIARHPSILIGSRDNYSPSLQMSFDDAARRGWGRTAPPPLLNHLKSAEILNFRFLSISTCA